MTEVIIFKEKINSAQRIIIENYLSAKYDIGANANDLYDEDDNANGDYDYDVAGIGRINASTLHNDAQGTGIVRILNPSDLGDDEYLIWGRDNGIQQAIEVADIPTSVQARFQRVWRSSEVNTSGSSVDVGSIDLRFDLSGMGAITDTDLRLLVDTNNDGFFADETPIARATLIGGDVYEFTGITANENNLRFTLGTINLGQTPLPVEIVSLEAKPVGNNRVKLTWKTQTEINNHYFTTQRSKEGVIWEDIAQIQGAGNSSVVRNYNSFDEEPYEGISYYRLQQTDYNGQSDLSQVVSVSIGQQQDASPVSIFPNPTSGKVTIEGNETELSEIDVYNILGRNVNQFIKFIDKSETSITVDLSQMQTGIYIIKTKTSFYKVQLQ